MLISRPRRNRQNSFLRDLLQENKVTTDDFIFPLFVKEGSFSKEEISSMPGIYRFSLDLLMEECEILLKFGIKAIALFPALSDEVKDKEASESLNPEGLYLKTISTIKSTFPELIIFSDVAMDPYSSDGHDGFVDDSGKIDNDYTLAILGKMSLAQAESGSDFVAPSDMMDGRVAYIRNILDGSGYSNVGIMSYTAKYASAYYGPFRDALDSAPKKGDKKTYQMNPANSREALREAELDIQEGADIIIVKPGLPYLDVIKEVREYSNIPVAAYNVSGEYAMIQAAAQNGWLNYQDTVMENMMSFKRAGADLILSYHSKEVAEWLS